MAPVWTAERMILLENAISERGYAWTLFATDPAFGLTAFSAPALRVRFGSTFYSFFLFNYLCSFFCFIILE